MNDVFSKLRAKLRDLQISEQPAFIIARALDQLANFELQHGHRVLAEHLARRAEALRAEVAR
jgi:hypothetical protein